MKKNEVEETKKQKYVRRLTSIAIFKTSNIWRRREEKRKTLARIDCKWRRRKLK